MLQFSITTSLLCWKRFRLIHSIDCCVCIQFFTFSSTVCVCFFLMESNKLRIIFTNIWLNDTDEDGMKKKPEQKTTLHNGKNIFPSCLSPFMTFRFLVKLCPCCCCCCCFFFYFIVKANFLCRSCLFIFPTVEFIFSVYVIPKIMSYSHLSGRMNAEKTAKIFSSFSTDRSSKRQYENLIR